MSEPTERTRDRSLQHLLARLDLLTKRVQVAVARRREIDPDPNDRFRGLYLGDAAIDDLLSTPRPSLWDPSADDISAVIELQADEWEAQGERLRLRRLASAFALDLTDIDILLVALAPDLDPRFERLYGYLHDDVTRRRASVGLALELSGIDPSSADGRSRIVSSGELVAAGLLTIEDQDRPLLTRSLRIPDRVSAHLVGDDSFEPGIATLLLDVPTGEIAEWMPLDTALTKHMSPIYLRETAGTSAASVAAASVARAGRRPLLVDLSRLAATNDPASTVAAVVREARMRDWVLVAMPVESLLDPVAATIETLAEAPCSVILAGARAWDPAWARVVPLLLEVPQPTAAERAAQWTTALNGHSSDAVLLRATQAFRLTPLQVSRAAQAGRLSALAHDRDVEPHDLQAGARSQNAAGLDRLSHHVQPRASWSDLVLPPGVLIQLHELAARARQRERVHGEWGIGGNASRGRGITALFAGDSGTGKTLASEVVSHELGLDLYVIDLSTVVDKYIGETEKNLDRIFAEADRVNGVLLFDEADAIFGKRSEVKDARDRYANVEIAYLLQRMERFDGLAVLTTNLRANLDDAFTRRIDVIVDFPMPEEDDRRALWRMHLPPELPQADDIDLDFTARRFRFSGGNIRNVCLTAAFFAAEADRAVGMSDLIRGTEREYRKLGRLTVEDEFGPYLAMVAAE